MFGFAFKFVGVVLGGTPATEIFDANVAQFGGNIGISAGDVLDIGTVNYSCVVRFKSTNAGNEQMITKMGDELPLWRLYLGAGKITCDLRQGVSNRWLITSTGPSFNDGEWHDLLVYFDRSNDTLFYYVDGILLSHSFTISSGSMDADITNARDLVLGGTDDSVPQPFDGSRGASQVTSCRL